MSKFLYAFAGFIFIVGITMDLLAYESSYYRYYETVYVAVRDQVLYVGPFDGLNSWQKNLSSWNVEELALKRLLFDFVKVTGSLVE